MKITKTNLFKNGVCRFCSVKEDEKHYNCYHGFADLFGLEDLGLEFREDDED